MRAIHIFPETVMNAIGAHLDHHKEVPLFILYAMARETKTLIGHGEDLIENAVLLIGAKIVAIENIAFRDALDFGFKIFWIGKIALRAGREKTGDEITIERLGRIGLWHSDHDTFFSLIGKDLPYRRLFDLRGIGDRHLGI